MTPSEISENNPGLTRSIGPGDRLQAARVEQGLSVEDVATRMHLSVAILESIEENNFDDITAPIFVKGYLRAYARIVSIDEDEMIQQYLNYYSDEDPPINPSGNLSPEMSSEDARAKWTTYLVILGIIALLTAWWWNQYQTEAAVVSLDAESREPMELAQVDNELSGTGLPEAEINSQAPLEDNSEAFDQAEMIVEQVAYTDTSAPEPATVVEVDDQQVDTQPVDIQPVDIQPVDIQPVDIQPVENPQPVAEAEVEVAAILPTAETVEPDASADQFDRFTPLGSEQLKLVVHADSWVDIKDASGRSLIYQLLQADQEISLTGLAPFNVFLGNGHGVELIFKNETIDISARIRDDNTARIRVGS